MGHSRDEFTKYPRTPHLVGSHGTADDRHLAGAESAAFLADCSLIVEEKLDGTNVGLHFTSAGEMVLQCRGHRITEGMHPQYDLFKQWAAVKRATLEACLEDRLILFGEWLYAQHTVRYRRLPHYFFEFDLYDKSCGQFLSFERRRPLIDRMGVQTVPILHRGAITAKRLMALIGPSGFDSQFDNPVTGRTDAIMEGLYLRTEAEGVVTGRAKLVRPEFIDAIGQSVHWQSKPLVANGLVDSSHLWM